MIILLVTLPIIASLSTIAFQTMKLNVLNYESNLVPYSLGSVILYCYAVLYSFPPLIADSISFSAYFYILGVWLLGLIDDIYGARYPKGLKGHFRYFLRNKLITTGLLKAIGTLTLATIYIWLNPSTSFYLNLLSLFLLVGLPHVMNLFDTRPLRVWKIALCFAVLLLLTSPVPSFLFVITIFAVFYTTFVIEGHKKAMLGDNGATAVGAILAVIIVNETAIGTQVSVLLAASLIVLLAERWSLSSIIEKSTVLRTIDRIGVSEPKR